MESVLFASRQWWVGGAQSVIECAAGMNPPSLLPVSLIPIIYLPVTRSFALRPFFPRPPPPRDARFPSPQGRWLFLLCVYLLPFIARRRRPAWNKKRLANTHAERTQGRRKIISAEWRDTLWGKDTRREGFGYMLQSPPAAWKWNWRAAAQGRKPHVTLTEIVYFSSSSPLPIWASVQNTKYRIYI